MARYVRRVPAPGGVANIALPNVAWWEVRFPGCNLYLPYHPTYFERETLARAVNEAGLAPVWSARHESFSTWFLLLVRACLGIKPNAVPRIAASIGRVPRWWPIVEHPYRVAMVGAGVVTWPLRHFQGTLGRGDELVMVARAES